VLIEADEDEVERFELPAWEPLANLAAALRALWGDDDASKGTDNPGGARGGDKSVTAGTGTDTPARSPEHQNCAALAVSASAHAQAEGTQACAGAGACTSVHR
jgi:hypothetical protein